MRVRHQSENGDDFDASKSLGAAMRWSLKSLMLFMTGLAMLTVLVGKLPKAGRVAVLQENQDRVEVIIATNSIKDWIGISGTGGTLFQFRSGFDLWHIEEQLLADAKAKGYWIRIEYQALLSIYDSSREQQ